ncbi:fork head domain-containing protein [Xylariaceae sp. FL0255]|nr:fork head domain-containing protein [Xylariaceae sp. FL0255]
MPPSSKRSQRTRRARDSSPSPAVVEQSSPTRPVKRRKRADEPDPSSEPVDEGNSSRPDMPWVTANGNEDNTDNETITRVTKHLRTRDTNASRDHANSKHDDDDQGVITAFAKIAAQDWTYYIKTLTVNIGRHGNATENSEAAHDPHHPDFIHLDLGPSKQFSRQLGEIYFDTDFEKWFIRAKGRNGLRVDTNLFKKGDPPHELKSGEVIEVNGLEMMFFLPANVGPTRIHDKFLAQAGVNSPTRTALPPLPSSDQPSSQSTRPGSRSQTSQQPIAPAPPDYKRPGTPPSSKSRLATSQTKTPARDAAASRDLIDLKKDENKHIKPNYSYAQMITQAIIAAPGEKLNLAGIYQYIMDNYAYYRNQPIAGWQNSIRHNLSLNKSFAKAPRSTDEPGKGMKWKIVPDARDEMVRTCWSSGRGGHRGSSAPSSPSQPSQMTYITSGPKDMASKEPGSARKRKVASPDTSPPPRAPLSQSQMTPDRKILSPSFQDDSPLPRGNKRLQITSSFTDAPQSPLVTSSTYAHDEGASFVTPAPQRLHPRLAPPSTAQKPSQHMPTSSPAPFWQYLNVDSTPLQPPYDISPIKRSNLASSPPPPAGDDNSPSASPTRPNRVANNHDKVKVAPPEKVEKAEEEEEQSVFDLTRGFQTIQSYHAPTRAA